MSHDGFVVDVNQASFDKYVLLNSHKIPVLVEFMGVWSGPCVAMDLLFSSLAREFPEQFIFARVDVDEQEELRKQYNIENLPTLLVFQGGELVRTEVGELKEDEARALLEDFNIYHESDVMREEARQKHMAGDSAAAIIQLSEAIKSDPSNVRVAMDMVQVFIDIKETEQAQSLFARLPESVKDTEMGRALSGQLSFASLAADLDDIGTLKQRIMENPDDSAARFDLSLCLVAEHQYQDAVDHLFYIQQHDETFKDGAAKEMLATISKMLAASDLEFSQAITRKLANMLAQ